MQQIVIDSEVFDELKPLLKPHIKDKCDFCGEEIDKNNFGLLEKNFTICKSLLCLTEYFGKKDVEDNLNEKEKGQ